jgi:UDP-N-acetylglucosamine/UDP-N-acetylgalactosamine diphosphorylase
MKYDLLARLTAHAQQHLLDFWNELDEPQRQTLLAQIAAVDFDRLTQLFRAGAAEEDWKALAERAAPPPAVRLGASSQPFAADDARRAGSATLAHGEIGVLLVAGGQGTRLCFDHPKGMYPIGPVSGASLFQIHLEKILAVRRRYGRPIPLYLMTSPHTHDETLRFLAQKKWFGLAAHDVVVFRQGTIPSVDAATGKVLMSGRGELALSPDGHGGVVSALDKSGALADVRRRKLKHLFYFQVDNPLTPVCDAELIGYHVLAGSELTSLVVAKRSPDDRLGNAVMVDGKLRIIEYIDLPADAARKRNANGSLVFWAGSTAIHVMAVALIERTAQSENGLPFHVSRKVVPYIDRQGGPIQPREPNALKFERFVFDLLPASRQPLVVEGDRSEVFAPLKNASGAADDTPEMVRARMAALHRQWLRAAGATVPENVPVEISPLFATSTEQLVDKIRRGLHVDKPTYFR